ncbi:MAG: hypothetical protein Q8M92_04850, partial [Candidatus Subteraquimicrobiales bacterium]|nr:hypothetical protein [Candidatus Subteraquimicrobiales bacterium]
GVLVANFNIKKNKMRFVKRRSRSWTKTFLVLLFGVILVYLLVAFLGRMGEKQKIEGIKSYVETANKLVKTSNSRGLAFSRAFGDAKSYPWEKLKEKLVSWTQEEKICYEKTKAIKIPEGLEKPHASLVICLKLRAHALEQHGLALNEALANQEIESSVDKMTSALRRLALSDEAYLLYVEEMKDILKKEGLNLTLATSVFLTKDVSCDRTAVSGYVVQLKGLEFLEEIRGVGIINLITDPPQGGMDLSKGVVELPKKSKLRVTVTVENQGNQVEVDIPVVGVCLSEDGKFEQRKEAKISLLALKEKKDLTIEFAPPSGIINTITITAGPIKGETLIKNNSMDFLFIMI